MSTPLLVCYGSQTGTAAALAKGVAVSASLRNFDVRCIDLKDISAKDLSSEKLIIVLTSTFGNGEPPANAFDFFHSFPALTNDELKDVKCGIFGLGASNSPEFNKAAKDLQHHMTSKGANLLVPTGFGDELADGGHDAALQPWLNELWTALGASEGKGSLPCSFNFKKKDGAKAYNGPVEKGLMEVVANTNMTTEDFEDVSVNITLKADGKYALGGYVEVFPEVPKEVVDRACKRFAVDATQSFLVEPSRDDAPKTPAHVQARDVFTHILDVSAAPSRSLLEGFSIVASDAKEAAALMKLSTTTGKESEYALRMRSNFSIMTILEEYPSINITIAQAMTVLPRVVPRYYSIASSPKVSQNIDLCVSVDKSADGKRVGLCSNYIANLKAGEKMIARAMPGVTLPAPEVPVCALAIGSAIGVMRSIIQDRQAAKAAGQKVALVTLFFGIKRKASTYLYVDELEQFQKDGLVDITVAASRDEDKIRITDAITANPKKVSAAVAGGEGAYVYCGLGGAIPRHVEETVRKSLQESEGWTRLRARAMLRKMRQNGRMVVEAYSKDAEEEALVTGKTKRGTKAEGANIKTFADANPDAQMLCYQCEQTQNGTGCVTTGVCGKTPTVAQLQDLLIHHCKALGWFATEIRQIADPADPLAEDADANRLTMEAAFATLTNVNFDEGRIIDYVRRINKFTKAAEERLTKVCKAKGVDVPVCPLSHDELSIPSDEVEELAALGAEVSILERMRELYNDSLVGAQELIIYGIKGLSAYSDHALLFGHENPEIYKNMQEALHFLLTPAADDLGQVLAKALMIGKTTLTAGELLYNANATLGKPTPHSVPVVPRPGKCIVFSGHDLWMLSELLKQCEGTDVYVYTHGEMLPAFGYPQLRDHPHLAGHYGAAWQRQAIEFTHFPGSIIMSTNCLTPVLTPYADRMYTAGAVAWPNVKHIHGTGKLGNLHDFSPVIAKAQELKGFTEEDKVFAYPKDEVYPCPTKLTTGFGHEFIIANAGTILDAVKAGEITRFFLIGGCDGYEGERSYYTELAKELPEKAVILTLGCGKFRVNHLDYDTIGDTGIPRCLDMGQCNDSYGAVMVALALAGALGCEVSDLPLSIVLSWFEQKAVAVLLKLLALGIKPIRIGPQLPAFVGPEVLNILVKDFGVRPVGDAKKDVASMMAAKGMLEE